jgi:serine/threonine protein kinase
MNESAASQFHPYRLERLIGEGGMGVVYLAEHVDLGTPVAIKILRDAWLSPARRRRFEAEQRILAQLTHHGIARLYDAQTLADGTPWFVMEYVDGLPLTEYCERRGSPIGERLELFRKVCDAVQYAHDHGIVHRDLKPSNILVKSDGSVRLLDFGIAVPFADNDAQARRDATAMLMTPAYSSPEQLRGDHGGSPSDVYSLGVILHELATGTLPSRSGRFTAGDLDVICATALDPNPSRRYPSVTALVRDLDRFQRVEPLEVRRGSLAYAAGVHVWRNGRRLMLSAAALILVAVAAYTGASLRDRSGVETSVTASRSNNDEAYELYLRGASGLYDPGPTNTASIRLLERAVELDPSYAAAWLALARRRYVEARFGKDTDTALVGALDAARKALDLDPSFAPAIVRLSQSQVEFGNAVQAYREIAPLLRKFPENPDVHFGMALVYRYAGLLDDAARECAAAVSMDPGNWTWRSCAVVPMARGDYDAAMAYLRLDGQTEFRKALTIHAMVGGGREVEAVRLGPPALAQWKSFDMLLACAAGRPPAEIAARAAAVQPQPDPESNYYAAAHFAYCGLEQQAIEMLTRAIDRAYCSYPHVDTDPYFARVRTSPAFAAVRSAAIACQQTFLEQRARLE